MRRVCFILSFMMIRVEMADADVLFGNNPDGSYGYSIYSSYPEPYVSGAAVSFTPTGDLSISSVTLWLADYTQPCSAELLEGDHLNSLSEVALFVSATPNDGSQGQFTFDLGCLGSGDTYTLSANETYWLFVYGNYSTSGTIEWLGGTAPSGTAAYNGTATYEGDPTGSFFPGLSASAPAFFFNSVPEPATVSLVALGVASVWCLYRRK